MLQSNILGHWCNTLVQFLYILEADGTLLALRQPSVHAETMEGVKTRKGPADVITDLLVSISFEGQTHLNFCPWVNGSKQIEHLWD